MQFVGPVSNLSKIVLGAIGLWFLTLIVLYVFPHLLTSITGLAGLLSLPLALVLLILALVALIKDKNRVWPALSIVLILDEKFQISQYFESAEHLTGDWYLVHFYD